MEHGLLAKSPRIEVVDALRGFAVMAIMLLHNIEHFNFYDFPTASSAFMEAMDKGIWETLFFLFSVLYCKSPKGEPPFCKAALPF